MKNSAELEGPPEAAVNMYKIDLYANKFVL